MIWKICPPGWAEYALTTSPPGRLIYTYSVKPEWQTFHTIETLCTWVKVFRIIPEFQDFEADFP